MTSKKIAVFLTGAFFILNQLALPVSSWAAIGTPAFSEVNIPKSFQLEIPSELGTIESIATGTGPTILHIQEAHGSYEVQKKIEALLKHLKDKYGINNVLIEGSSFELQPELLNFFPDKPELNLEIAEELAKKGIVSGPELFLFKEEGTHGQGIEDLRAYIENGAAFKEVLKQQEKTKVFLENMNLQIERLTSPYLNKNLRHFLNRLDAYEAQLIPFDKWLNELKVYASKHLEVDLENPWFQVEWPMLLKIFTLKDFESKLDMSTFKKERNKFFKAISSLPQDIQKEVKQLLSSSISGHGLSDPETSLLFEKMVTFLPEDFDYKAYPNVNLFIGHLILQSELKGDRLIEEMNAISDKIAGALAEKDKEKGVVRLLKDYRMLKRLFALELSPEDHSVLSNPEIQSRLRPSVIISNFLKLNDDNLVKNIQFQQIDEIDILFDRALDFYSGATERDGSMIKNIESRMNASKMEKTVVITGGFHSGPFKEYFEKQGYNYALITPKMTQLDNRKNYIDSILHSLDSPLLAMKSTYMEGQNALHTLVQRALLGTLSVEEEQSIASEVVQLASEIPVQEVLFRINENRFTGEPVAVKAKNGSVQINSTLMMLVVQQAISRSELRMSIPRRSFLKSIGAAVALPVINNWTGAISQESSPQLDPRDVDIIRNSFEGISNYLSGPSIGIHKPTGAPVDHVTFDPETLEPLETGNYGAPSKDAAYFQTLWHIADSNPLFSKIKVSKDQALDLMIQDLDALNYFQANYDADNPNASAREVKAGLLPWNNKLDNKRIRAMQFNARIIVPSLDNAMLTMALAGIAGSYWDASASSKEATVRDLAQAFLKRQDYKKFTDERGKVFQIWDFEKDEAVAGSQLDSIFTEWGIAYYWSHWTGLMDQETFLKMPHATFSYNSEHNPIDMPEGFVYSFHERWELQYYHEAMMKSKLAPLMRNFLYMHARHARENNLPGFVASEYAPDGQYKGVGIDISKHSNHITKEPVSVQTNVSPYATSMGALIDPVKGLAWLAYNLQQPGVVNKNGIVTSFNRTQGASFVYSADNTFVTLASAAEGYNRATGRNAILSRGISRYLKEVYQFDDAKIVESFNAIAEAELKRLGLKEFRSVSLDQIASPPEKRDYSVTPDESQITPEVVPFAKHLVHGDWHAKNSKTPKQFDNPEWKVKADADRNLPWVMKPDASEIAADFELLDDDPFAFLGTTMNPVKIDKIRFVSYWLPADMQEGKWNIELKSGQELADRIEVDASKEPIEYSEDRKWKRYIQEVKPNDLAKKLPLNYMAISSGEQKVLVHIKDIELSIEKPKLTRSEMRRPPELTVKELAPNSPENQRSLDKLRDHLRGYLIDFGTTHVFGSLKDLDREAKKMNPNFNSGLTNDDLDNPQAKGFSQFFERINDTVFLPMDEYFAISIRNFKAEWHRWVVDPESWYSRPYLSTNLWSSTGRWVEGGLEGNYANAFAYRYPSVDKSSIRHHELGSYARLETMDQLPYSLTAGVIREAEIDADKYADLIVSYVANEEYRHAEDTLFAELLFSEDLNKSIHPRARISKAILKPTSFILRNPGFPSLDQLPSDIQKAQVLEEQLVNIIELSGQLGGLLNLMDQRIQNDPDAVYLLFIYQFIRSYQDMQRYTQIAQQRPAGPVTLRDGPLFYAMTGNLFIENLKKVRFFSDKKTDNIQNIANALNSIADATERAKIVRSIIAEIYELHFKTDEERGRELIRHELRHNDADQSLAIAAQAEKADDSVRGLTLDSPTEVPLQALRDKLEQAVMPSESSANSEIQQLTDSIIATSFGTFVETHNGLLVPNRIADAYGVPVFRAVAQRITHHLNPVTKNNTTIKPELEVFMRQNTPLLNRLLNRAFDKRRIFDDPTHEKETALEAITLGDLAPLLPLLRKQRQLEYTLILSNKTDKENLWLALREPSFVTKLGFDPTTELSNFHIEVISDVRGLTSYMTKNLSGTMEPTGLISRREQVLDEFPTMKNWVPILEKTPESHGNNLVIFATLIDELTKDILARHDDESLRSLDQATQLIQEIVHLRAFLTAA